MAADTPLSPGSQILHYRVTGKLGAGGMGEVWKAHDSTLGRDVALKALPAGFASDPERLARFEREAKLLASIPRLEEDGAAPPATPPLEGAAGAAAFLRLFLLAR